ncbi:DUF4184 family protein [Streptomyces sp. NPDC053367]|uniref:DUF4184 family protein n=1 Tax=Streptomyces sp. NPDC053367 TaxID=3365700 RepID=UPI0037D33487
MTPRPPRFGGFLVTHVAALRAEALGGLTVARSLQYLSTLGGLAAIGLHQWRRRGRLRADGDPVTRLRPVARWSVVTALMGAAVPAGVAQARTDFGTYRFETVADLRHPVVRDLGRGTTEITHPTRAVEAPWGTVAEGVLTGAAKTAGTTSAAALLLFPAAWHTRRLLCTEG